MENGTPSGGSGQAQRRAELRLLQAQHADAVFELREFLIKFLRRQLAPRLEIHLIGAEEDARAEFFHALVAEGVDEVERLGRVLGRERCERIEPSRNFVSPTGTIDTLCTCG